MTPFQMAICFGTTVANMIVAGQAMKVGNLLRLVLNIVSTDH